MGLRLIITREAAVPFSSLIELRAKYLYPSPYDERYWGGGLHFALDENRMRTDHASDLGSHFAFAFSETGVIQAYARFSVVEDAGRLLAGAIEGADGIVALQVHVIIALPELRGQAVLWEVDGAFRRGRTGPVMYDEIFRFGRTHGAQLVVADICMAPIPNLASLHLHRALGFDVLRGPLLSFTRRLEGEQTANVQFARLVKAITLDAHLLRTPDGRLRYDHRPYRA